MATHCSVLAWGIPETAEPGGLPSMGSHRVGHGWSDLAAAAAATAWAVEPGSLQSIGSQRVRQDWVTNASLQSQEKNHIKKPGLHPRWRNNRGNVYKGERTLGNHLKILHITCREYFSKLNSKIRIKCVQNVRTIEEANQAHILMNATQAWQNSQVCMEQCVWGTLERSDFLEQGV